MPDSPPGKARPHPSKRDAPKTDARAGPRAKRVARYAELAVTSNYTFLTGASHPEELVERAAELGHAGVAITDHGSLAGVVRAHVAAKQAGIPLAVGARLTLGLDGVPEAGNPPDPARLLQMLVYPTCRASYGRLCRLLTLGKRRGPKGFCLLSLHDLIEHQEGLLGVVLCPRYPGEGFVEALGGLQRVFIDDRLSLALSRRYGPEDEAMLRAATHLAEHARVPPVAVNDVLCHEPDRRVLQDVLTCIRSGCTIAEAGLRLQANAERHLKPPEEMARLFGRLPAAVARSAAIIERASAFGLDQLRYEYPDEPCPPGVRAIDHLRMLALQGAHARYCGPVPRKTLDSLDYELRLVEELGYEAYFLTCHDIVVFARSRGIFCQGRGGAANSALCYCLGITEVDPATHSLLFERFISRERGEPPDIDIDFEHERREEVIQYIYARYGRDRAALTAEVISYRGRSAVREVGKALGLSLDRIDALAKRLDHWGGGTDERALREAGLDPADPTCRRIVELTAQLAGFPRHLSQHVGGFVITRGPLCELVPIENAAMEDRTVIEWDKDDIDALGILKVDVLGLGMLTCLRKAVGTVVGGEGTEAHRDGGTEGQGHNTYSLFTSIAADPTDPAVYEMICSADTVGVFQIESRAQMTMLPRLRPREFYDLVIEVAIVRPGPIQGKMVHPYLRRRNGEEPVVFPGPEVEAVLGRTLGVPLFQEQAMQLSIVAAGFTPDEADALRRAMAAWKRKGDMIYRFGARIIDGMVARGYSRDFAERCFEQIKGFSEYGFPESHAASFAILVYASAWLKRHHPAAFAAALINSQPMGFYQPAQIVRDAREHGVEVRPVDVNFSAWDCTLEPTQVPRPKGVEQPEADPACWGEGGPALRLGLRMVDGLGRQQGELIARLVDERRRSGGGPVRTVEELWKAGPVQTRALRTLAAADAFASMGLDRQRAIWAVRSLRDQRLPLFDHLQSQGEHTHENPPQNRPESRQENSQDPEVDLPRRPDAWQVLQDYRTTGLSLRRHPVSFIRDKLDARGVSHASSLLNEAACPNGTHASVAGIVLIRQRPGTASGVVFITLEDETGVANLVVWPKVFERYRSIARLSRMLLASGKVERQGAVVHLHAARLEPLDGLIRDLRQPSRDFH